MSISRAQESADTSSLTQLSVFSGMMKEIPKHTACPYSDEWKVFTPGVTPGNACSGCGTAFLTRTACRCGLLSASNETWRCAACVIPLLVPDEGTVCDGCGVELFGFPDRKPLRQPHTKDWSCGECRAKLDLGPQDGTICDVCDLSILESEEFPASVNVVGSWRCGRCTAMCGVTSSDGEEPEDRSALPTSVRVSFEVRPRNRCDGSLTPWHEVSFCGPPDAKFTCGARVMVTAGDWHWCEFGGLGIDDSGPVLRCPGCFSRVMAATDNIRTTLHEIRHPAPSGAGVSKCVLPVSEVASHPCVLPVADPPTPCKSVVEQQLPPGVGLDELPSPESRWSVSPHGRDVSRTPRRSLSRASSWTSTSRT